MWCGQKRAVESVTLGNETYASWAVGIRNTRSWLGSAKAGRGDWELERKALLACEHSFFFFLSVSTSEWF